MSCMIIYLGVSIVVYCFFFFKQKTAYEMRISDWSSDVCSSDLVDHRRRIEAEALADHQRLSGRIEAAGREEVVERLHGVAGAERAGREDLTAHDVEQRSEERRVGKKCVSTCRTRLSPEPLKTNKIIEHRTQIRDAAQKTP